MSEPTKKTNWLALALAWTWAGVPLAWGVWQTVQKATALFGP